VTQNEIQPFKKTASKKSISDYIESEPEEATQEMKINESMINKGVIQ